MQQTIIDTINQFGYFGVFLLIAAENIFPPIPSEIILTFSGFITTYTAMNVWGVILAATAGSVIGAILLYAVGRFLNTERLEYLFASHLGKLLHLKNGDVKQAEKWFLKHGNTAVFFCRFIPIVRSLISIPAGMAKMNVYSFLILTVIGTFIWNMILVFLGRITGTAWETIAHYVDIYAKIAAVSLAVLVVFTAAFFVKKRFFKDDNP